MHFRPLSIEGAWEVTPRQHTDDRGVFLETFTADTFARETGRPFVTRQFNTSVSATGVVRGVHFADVPPSQAKYVTCTKGAVLDVVVDVRLGSPTFGTWDSVLLDEKDRRSIFISEGLGHAFCSLAAGSTVTYLCSEQYAPGREHAVHPLDPDLSIRWPSPDGAGTPRVLSPKDSAAPTLREATDMGLLPSYADALAYVRSLAGRNG